MALDGKSELESSPDTSHRRRASQRAAALVEAAVVMPVIVCFLGMMMWFHSLHVTEETAQLAARRAALTRASHGCGLTGGSFDDSVSDAVGGGYGGDALGTAGGLFAGAMSLAFTPSRGEGNGTAQGGLFAKGWTHPVHRTSVVMCNEPKYPQGLAGLLPFATRLAAGFIKNSL